MVTKEQETIGENNVTNVIEKPNPSEIKGVYDDFSAQDFLKSQKKGINSEDTHPLNREEKAKPQETKGVSSPLSSVNSSLTEKQDKKIKAVLKGDYSEVEL